MRRLMNSVHSSILIAKRKFLFFAISRHISDGNMDFFSTPRILKAILKTGRYLKISYSKMLRIIDLLCEINRIEEVRLHFSIVNTLITTVKQVFLKVHNHIRIHK